MILATIFATGIESGKLKSLFSQIFCLNEWLIAYPFSDRLLHYSFSLAGANGGM